MRTGHGWLMRSARNDGPYQHVFERVCLVADFVSGRTDQFAFAFGLVREAKCAVRVPYDTSISNYFINLKPRSIDLIWLPLKPGSRHHCANASERQRVVRSQFH